MEKDNERKGEDSIMANDVKWIKITTDIFDDEKFDAIETLTDKHMIQLAWIKLLCLAGKCNDNGFLMLTREIPYTDEMIANRFRMSIGDTQRALQFFQQLHMIEVVDNIYMVSNWSLHQNQKGLEDIKKQHAEAQQRYRDKQKIARISEKKESDITSDITSDIIPSYSISNSNNKSNSFSKEIKEIIDYLNIKLNKRYTYSNKSYNAKINARLKEGFTVDDFKTVIDKKCNDWLGKEYEQYLTPDTLFAPSKFEKYLNQSVIRKSTSIAEQQLNETKDALSGFLGQGE